MHADTHFLVRAAAFCTACPLSHVINTCRYGNDMHTRNWCWLLFFVLQGVIVGLEGFGKMLLKRSGVIMPHGLAVGITVSLQMWLAHILFFPAVTDAELNVKVYVALLNIYHVLRRCVM